jgi:hypothetical protein
LTLYLSALLKPSPLDSLTLGIQGIFLYTDNATLENLRLRLQIKVAENFYPRILPDMSCGGLANF